MSKILFAFITLLLAFSQVGATPPLSLSSARGELPLTFLAVAIEVTPTRIATRIEAEFSNPYAEILQARLRFTMPDDAQLGAFRVFYPVPLRETPPLPAPPASGGFHEVLLIENSQRVILSYSQTGSVYHFPLAGLEAAELRLEISGARHLQAPPESFSWEVGADQNLHWQGTHATQNLLLKRATPPAPTSPKPLSTAPNLAELQAMQEKSAALTGARDSLQQLLDNNQRMSESNRDLHHELEDTRARLREVENQLREMLEMQQRFLNRLEQQLTPTAPD
jgi:hypothetical protein